MKTALNHSDGYSYHETDSGILIAEHRLILLDSKIIIPEHKIVLGEKTGIISNEIDFETSSDILIATSPYDFVENHTMLKGR